MISQSHWSLPHSGNWPKKFKLSSPDSFSPGGTCDLIMTLLGNWEVSHDLHLTQVLIQPSARRAYTMPEYKAAGAVFTDDLSEADCIVGE